MLELSKKRERKAACLWNLGMETMMPFFLHRAEPVAATHGLVHELVQGLLLGSVDSVGV